MKDFRFVKHYLLRILLLLLAQALELVIDLLRRLDAVGRLLLLRSGIGLAAGSAGVVLFGHGAACRGDGAWGVLRRGPGGAGGRGPVGWGVSRHTAFLRSPGAPGWRGGALPAVRRGLLYGC